MLETLMCAIAGATAYRIRGGAGNSLVQKLLHKPAEWEIPNGIIRGIWALFITVMMYLHGVPLQWLPVVLALAFLGVALGYFNGEFDLSKPENRNWRNYTRLTLRGAWITFPVAVLMTILLASPIWLSVAAGACLVPCYLIGYAVNSRFKYMGGSQYGELGVGFLIGLALS